MRLALNISHDVEEADEKAKAILEDVVNQETRQFAHTVTARLEAEGVRIEGVKIAEGGG